MKESEEVQGTDKLALRIMLLEYFYPVALLPIARKILTNSRDMVHGHGSWPRLLCMTTRTKMHYGVLSGEAEFR